MSELISGKEALIALANGEEVEWRSPEWSGYNWHSVLTSPHTCIGAVEILNETYHREDTGSDQPVVFRLKPRTVNLNGVDVGLLYSSQWDKQNPNKVTIEFNTEEEARHFNNNALKIFNGV